MFESPAHFGLSLSARCLLLLLQCHWRNEKPVDYGIREAAEKLGVDRRIAMRAFKELQTAGFIRLADESLFNSRTGSKARSWVLTWLPYRDRPPTNDWERSKSSGT